MKNYRALVVDDERLARNDLISHLKEFDNIEIVSEAEDVPSALIEIEKHSPDLLFLDIQMPGQSGFELLNKIDFKGKVIFVTAYDKYAIRAFDVNAIDYLMKPILPERLRKSIERLEEDQQQIIVESKKLNMDDRLFINFNDQMRFLKVSAIVHIEANGDYTNLYLKEGDKGLVLKPMNEWEERLPEKYFCRIHRGSIINLDFVAKVEKWFNYSYRVYLNNIAEPITMSRRYAKKLKDKMG